MFLGHVDAIRALVELGANLSAEGPKTFTPLHLAAEYGIRICTSIPIEYLLF